MYKDSVAFVDVAEEHFDIIFKWRNEPFIREVMYNSKLLKWEDHVDWLKKLINDDSRIMKILFYNDTPYGTANFRFINKEDFVGEWGFYIGEKNSPKRMGTLLAYMMLFHLFENIGVRKVCAEVLDYNIVSLKFHEKIGFEKDGILRRHISKNGRYCDIHLYSIFEEEWIKSKVVIEKELFS